MRFLRFRYTNWNGEDHEYIVRPTRADLQTLQNAQEDGPVPCLHANILLRDGDPRYEMLGSRRRSFRIASMTELEEIEADTIAADIIEMIEEGEVIAE